MNNIKYYMNNPCVIVREITTELCEIQLNVHFADTVEGAQWCDGCMLGGTTSHACEEYDNVIDAIQDEKHSIFCIVECRLLHDRQIEMIKHDFILDKIDHLKFELKQRQELQKEWNADIKRREKLLNEVREEFKAIKSAKNEMLKYISKRDSDTYYLNDKVEK